MAVLYKQQQWAGGGGRWGGDSYQLRLVHIHFNHDERKPLLDLQMTERSISITGHVETFKKKENVL